MKYPVEALANVLGKLVMLDSNANCVAVYDLCVHLAIKAINATVPSPTPKYSKLTTKNNIQRSAPISDKAANPKIDITWITPKTHKALLMPIFSINTPPTNPPKIEDQSAAILATDPISALEKPKSK